MKYSIIILLAAVLFLVPSCTKDFEEINQNNNAPTSVTPQLLFPGIQRDMINQVMDLSWGIGNIVIQHTAKNQFVNEDRYLWGEINGIWNTGYNELRNLNNVLIFAEANNDEASKAVALVMKSWIYSLITDCYGDVPYTDAIKAKDGIYYVPYDPQETIYNGILSDLESANTILNTISGKVAGDLIYGGDLAKWQKLANSLRLRYLMRISRVKDVSAQFAAIVNNPTQNPIFESNADNAVYKYKATSPDQFPLFSARVGSFNEFRASKTLLDTLVSINDDRLFIFFRPTPATEGSATPEYIGIPNGLDDVTALTYAGGAENQSRISTYFFEDAVSAEGLQIAQGVMMTYAELQFILAEAAQKGWIASAAKTYYENGIKASFTYYGLDEPAADYFSQPLVTYEGGNELQKIGFQKWISLYYQGVEAWFDWRRTGIPALQPGVDNQNDDKIPVRFIYPIIEQALNGPNRADAISRQGEDNINTKMWYLK